MTAHRESRVKAAIRGLLVGVMIVLTAPLWLPVRLCLLLGSEAAFASTSELLSLVPTFPGVWLRRGFYWMCLEHCGLDCHIGFGTTLAHPQVRIGRGVYIGNRCTLGMLDLGDGVAIGSNVDLLSGRHQHSLERADVTLLEQGGTFARITIGRSSWIGNSAVVMADVGERSVVGAGSVVVKPVPNGVVAVGNPAVVKTRQAA